MNLTKLFRGLSPAPLLLLAAVCAFNSPHSAAARGKEGHGGIVEVCRNDDLTIRSIELLDLYEGRTRYSLARAEVPSGDPVATARQKITQALSNDPKLRDEVLHKLNDIEQNKRFIERNEALTPTGDVSVLKREKGCHEEQLATYSKEGTLWIDVNLWDALVALQNGATDLSALFTHEALYKLGREVRGMRDSDSIRPLVAMIYSSNSSRSSIEFKGKEIFGDPFADNGAEVFIELSRDVQGPVTLSISSTTARGNYSMTAYRVGDKLMEAFSFGPGQVGTYTFESGGSAAQWQFIYLQVNPSSEDFTVTATQGGRIVYQRDYRYFAKRGAVGVQSQYVFGMKFFYPALDQKAEKSKREKAKRAKREAEELLKAYDRANARRLADDYQAQATQLRASGKIEDAQRAEKLAKKYEKESKRGTGWVAGFKKGVRATSKAVFWTAPITVLEGVQITAPVIATGPFSFLMGMTYGLISGKTKLNINDPDATDADGMKFLASFAVGGVAAPIVLLTAPPFAIPALIATIWGTSAGITAGSVLVGPAVCAGDGGQDFDFDKPACDGWVKRSVLPIGWGAKIGAPIGAFLHMLTVKPVVKFVQWFRE